jgi:uncharacterized membrane protein
VFVGGWVALLGLAAVQLPGMRNWTLLWALLLLAGAALLAWQTLRAGAAGTTAPTAAVAARAEVFLWCVAGTGCALIAASEVVYLKDVFGGGDLFRMNTVFKLYFQAWLLLGVAATMALAQLLPTAVAQFDTLADWVQRTLDQVASRRVAPATSEPLQTPVALAASRMDAPVGAAATSGFSGPTASAYSADDDMADAMDEPYAGTPTEADHRPDVLRWVRPGGTLLWAASLVVLLGAAAVYPLQAAAARTANFTAPRSLDGTAYMASDPLNQGDEAAIAWLNDAAHVPGNPVILEAVDANGGEYTHFARISSFTGLPTIIGWVGHEWQWRVNWVNQPGHAGELNRRPGDVAMIYTSHDPSVVRRLLQQYHVRYVYVGAAERIRYPGVNLDQFSTFLHVVYRAGGVTIYEVS